MLCQTKKGRIRKIGPCLVSVLLNRFQLARLKLNRPKDCVILG